MSSLTPANLRQALALVRERGGSIAVDDLAQELLALDAPIERSLARRIVAAALGHSADALPDRLGAGFVRPAEEAAVAGERVCETDFVVVDLETTGLSARRSSILEIGAVRVSRLRPQGRFATLIRPPSPLSRAIADLTGIDDRMLADAPALHPALDAFRGWFENAGTVPFTAHNARFDAGFLARALRACDLPPLRAPVLCTQRLARRILPRLGRYDLDSVCAHFGVRNGARHRALGDAAATARVLIELVHLARVRNGVETVGDLLDLQSRPTRGRTRRRSR